MESYEKNRIKVLAALMDGACESDSDIAQKTSLSRQTVSRIKKNLKDEGTVWGYIPILDASKIGKKTFMLLWDIDPNVSAKDEYDFLKKFVSKINLGIDSRYILYIGKMHGPFDFMVLFLADSLRQARDRVEEWKGGITKKFGRCIKRIILEEEIFLFMQYNRLNPEKAVNEEKEKNNR